MEGCARAGRAATQAEIWRRRREAVEAGGGAAVEGWARAERTAARDGASGGRQSGGVPTSSDPVSTTPPSPDPGPFQRFPGAPPSTGFTVPSPPPSAPTARRMRSPHHPGRSSSPHLWRAYGVPGPRARPTGSASRGWAEEATLATPLVSARSVPAGRNQLDDRRRGGCGGLAARRSSSEAVGAGSVPERLGSDAEIRRLRRRRRRASASPSPVGGKRRRQRRIMNPTRFPSWPDTSNTPQNCGIHMFGNLFREREGSSIISSSEQQPSHESNPVEATTGSNGKKATGKGKQSNFSMQEDVVLVSCWLNVSTNSIVATGQRKSSFWKRLEQNYNARKGAAYPIRTLRSLEGRWDFIKDQVSKFTSYHRKVLLQHQSDHADADQTAAAITLFNSVEQRAFTVPHCWEVLKNEAKWLDLQEQRQRADGGGVADRVEVDIEQMSNSVDQLPEGSLLASQGTKRPLGRNSSKSARRRTSMDVASDTSGEFISRKSNMYLQKITYWRETDVEIKERLDKLVDIEERKLKLKEMLEDRWFTLERRKEDERIMAIDLDKCTPGQREMYEHMQSEILARWRS